MMAVILGIDPGASGGIAWINWSESDGRLYGVKAHKMPETPRDLAELLDGYTDTYGLSAVIERVSSRPGQGVSSTFKFGANFGMLQGVLAALEIPYDLVTPTVWQKAMGCLSGGDKNRTKAAAQRLFPSLKITHATADALLLAEYGRRVWNARNGGAA